MSQNVAVSVFEVVGSPLCVASSDGQKVYDRVAVALREGKSVVLSFLNVAGLTSAFLNAAIGQLYGEFTEQQVRELLRVEEMSPDDLALLKRVVDTAKEYFKDPDRFRRVVQDVLGEDADEE
jgi:hypothetical protein